MTTATGTISSAGIGSGLDVSAIVISLMAVEKRPLTKLQATATTMQTKLSAFGQMQSFMSTFRDAAAQLQKADSYSVTSSSSTDATQVGVASTIKAIPGSYAVSVTSLSSTQSAVSASGQFNASTDVVPVCPPKSMSTSILCLLTSAPISAGFIPVVLKHILVLVRISVHMARSLEAG